MLKILITGGSGLLALNWACFARDTFEVILALHERNARLDKVKSVFMSLDSEESILKVLNETSPDIVIHTAGFTNVDACEQDPELANHVNYELAKNVASACVKANVKMVHISTDHLFSGDVAYVKESDVTQTINLYAASKLKGELVVRALNPEALVVRTNFFGWGHQFRLSFSDWIYNNINNGKAITLFDDVYYTPILIDTLATYVHQLLALNANGVFNISSDERMSKYTFGMLLCEKFGLPSNLITKGSVSSLELLAPRPNDMSLGNQKLKQKLSVNAISVSHQLDQLKLQMESGRNEEVKNAIMES
tara:strand:+ start:427 stop:1350 length:924 start_codon:yes stop_codon:yes gene_type:complete